MFNQNIILILMSVLGGIFLCFFLSGRNIHKTAGKKRELNQLLKSLTHIAQPYCLIAQVNVDAGLCRIIKEDGKDVHSIHFPRKIDDFPDDYVDYEWWSRSAASYLVHEEARREFLSMFSLENIRQCLRMGRKCIRMVYRRWDVRTGTYRFAQAEIKVMSRRRGSENIMIFIRDIHGEKLLAERHAKELALASGAVRKANQKKHEFMETMSRDTQKMIHSLKNMNTLLRNALENGQYTSAFSYSDRLEDMLVCANTFLSDILDLSSLQYWDMECEYGEIDMEDLMKQCSVHLNTLCSDRSFSCMWTGSLKGRYRGNGRLLRKCLLWILDYFVLSHTEEGCIRVQTGMFPSKINRGMDEFAVKIIGKGIGEKKRQQMFTDVGALLVREAVESLHADIHVKNLHQQGVVLTFHFSLPRVAEKQEDNVHQKESLPILLGTGEEWNWKTG